MRLFSEFFGLIISFINGIFNELNNLAIIWNYNGNQFTIPYGWLILAGVLLLIITNTFWRGGRK